MYRHRKRKVTNVVPIGREEKCKKGLASLSIKEERQPKLQPPWDVGSCFCLLKQMGRQNDPEGLSYV